ncbi:hypothetical protein D3C81_942810 [compost metagenome]
MQPRGHQCAYIPQHDVAQLQAFDTGAIALAQAIGRAQGHAESFFELQTLGQVRRNRHIGRPGIEHEVHRLVVDLTAGDEMPLRIAHQFHLNETLALLRADHHVRILLTRFPLAEKTRGQKQRGTPGQYHKHPADALPRASLSHDLALQPPSGAAKRQTTGRTSPSARAPLLLSIPIQAPSASTTSASARP